MKTLNEVLTYSDPGVRQRFLRNWDVSPEAADVIFEDALRMLWLYARDRTRTFHITEPLVLLDEMWHEFILFTEEYTSFCNEYLGGYVHHAPSVAAPSTAPLASPAEQADAERDADDQLRAQVKYVYEMLGPDVAVRWYRELPRAYPNGDVRAIRVGARVREQDATSDAIGATAARRVA